MDYATTLNIDQQGRIIIPAKVRKALHLHTGDVLMLEADTRNICLRKCDPHIPMDIRLDRFFWIFYIAMSPCRDTFYVILPKSLLPRIIIQHLICL